MAISIEFHILVGNLKRKPRTGWVRRGIPNPESIADHTFRTQFMASDFARAVGEDPQAIKEIMENHDLPEIGAGDITPHCGISAQDKERRELESARHLSELSGNDQIVALYIEYQEKKTSRARSGNDVDQLEAVLQAIEYEVMYPEKRTSLEEFFPYAQDRLLTDQGKRYFDGLKDLWSGKTQSPALSLLKTPK